MIPTQKIGLIPSQRSVANADNPDGTDDSFAIPFAYQELTPSRICRPREADHDRRGELRVRAAVHAHGEVRDEGERAGDGEIDPAGHDDEHLAEACDRQERHQRQDRAQRVVAERLGRDDRGDDEERGRRQPDGHEPRADEQPADDRREVDALARRGRPKAADGHSSAPVVIALPARLLDGVLGGEVREGEVRPDRPASGPVGLRRGVRDAVPRRVEAGDGLAVGV